MEVEWKEEGEGLYRREAKLPPKPLGRRIGFALGERGRKLAKAGPDLRGTGTMHPCVQ